MLIELALIIIWISLLLYFLIKRKSKYQLSILLSSFIVGFFCVYIDKYFGEIEHTVKLYIPFLNYPISLIILVSLYVTTILSIRTLILLKVKAYINNKFIISTISLLTISILNLFYPVVDLIIVKSKTGVFANKNINLLYSTYTFDSSIIEYLFFAYIYFLMAIYLSLFFSYIFTKVNNKLVKNLK